MHHACLLAALVVCMAACSAAHGSRLSVSEESDVADAGDCESELVFERKSARGESTQRERSVRLTCGVGWNTELEAAHGRQHSDTQRHERLVFEAKTMLRDRSAGRIGWAVVLSLGADRGGGSWHHRELGLTVEATRQIGNAWLVEAKIGAVRDKLSRRDSTLWALALEHALHERVELRAELEGNDRERPQAKFGLRYKVWPDRLQINFAHGVRGGVQRERATSLGVQVEF
jgi:hypothetical protein